MKAKTIFVCKECGNESPKWMGKCPGCGSWNTYIEEKIERTSAGAASAPLAAIREKRRAEPKSITAVSTDIEERTSSGSDELDRVLGGGVVTGSLVLCGGEPGIGKSTLLLQVCRHIANTGTVLYISGEESERQIKMRADRLGALSENILVANETDLTSINEAIASVKPKTVIIDSVQTIYNSELQSSPGSVAQVRECTMSFMRTAKDNGITFFIVGHVTKDGNIAGPRVLEHMVDCVLYFEGERHQSYRIVRAVKNRFGSTNEIGVFEMSDKGLIDVLNPSHMLLSGRPVDVPGSAVVCSIEGTRPILAEIQALVARSVYPNPKRMAEGLDNNRASIIITVLEKRTGLNLAMQDSYINVTGGIKLDEPATDLAVAAAVASSAMNVPVPQDMAFFGEVGLTGELRTVTQAARRIAEIEKMGFKRCMLPFDSLGSIDRVGIELVAVKNLKDMIAYIGNR
ncbi:MAG: DNA repair protein RadA [Oscillospiraceae bacterium]|nr:DNA repair protein RadA [Oscillospiraceae bacterium]